jgi:hypothetical protein
MNGFVVPYTCELCDTAFAPSATHQRWCRECVPSSSWRWRASEYGLGKKDWDRLLSEQGGTCALCHRTPEHVDHRHADGAVRGLLCRRCNTLMAGIDDPSWLGRAQTYAITSTSPVIRKTQTGTSSSRFSHCWRGHPRTPENLRKDGRCAVCDRARRRKAPTDGARPATGPRPPTAARR